MGSMIGFAVVLFLAGGAIAYFGDRLGTYVGKKRISRFGLRPRHTAMLYTFFSGSAIALLTLLLLLGVDRNVRTALLEGQDMKNALMKQNESLSRQNKSMESKIAEAQTEVLSIQTKLTSSQDLLTKSKTLLAAKEAAVAQSTKSLKITGDQLDSAKQQVEAQLVALTDVQKHLQHEQRNLHLADVQVKSLSAQKQRLARDNDNLQSKKKALMEANAQISYAMGVLATGQMAYQMGQDLGRIEISTDQPVEAIKHRLQDWMDVLNSAAVSAGAGRGANGRALIVEPVAVRDADASQAGAPLPTEQENLELLAESIANEKGSVDAVVVVAYARYNTPAKVQAQVVLKPYADVLCFKQGQEIASCVVDGTQSPEVILNALTTFLMKQVRPVAAHAGIIPTYDPKTRDRSYGELVDKTSLVEQIQRLGSKATVTVVADTDTRASGPLNLRMVAGTPGQQLARPNETGSPVLVRRAAQDAQ